MHKILVMVLLAALALSARTNSSGYKYRDAIPVAGTAVAYGSTIYDAADAPTVDLIMKVDDSTAAGFADDSTEFGWGYQLGFFVLDSAGNVDTLWPDAGWVSVDTVANSGLGATDGSAYSTAQGTATFTWSGASGEADTSLIPGYAVQFRRVQVPFADVFRLYADGLTGNNADTLDLVIEAHFQRN